MEVTIKVQKKDLKRLNTIQKYYNIRCDNTHGNQKRFDILSQYLGLDVARVIASYVPLFDLETFRTDLSEDMKQIMIEKHNIIDEKSVQDE